jgi:hypothetical protein
VHAATSAWFAWAFRPLASQLRIMSADIVPMILALLAGIAVSAACGLRAFLPLLVLGLGSRYVGLELHPGLAWLSQTPP